MSRHDDILHFQGLPENKKNEVFDDCGPVTKCHLLLLLLLFSKNVTFCCFQVYQKIKNIEIFDNRSPIEKCNFCCFYNLAYLGSKSLFFFILGILMSKHDDILLIILKISFSCFHNCIFDIHIRDFLYFRYPDVKT